MVTIDKTLDGKKRKKKNKRNNVKNNKNDNLRYFHVNCIVCHSCGQTLAGRKFGLLKGNRVCEECIPGMRVVTNIFESDNGFKLDHLNFILDRCQCE